MTKPVTIEAIKCYAEELIKQAAWSIEKFDNSREQHGLAYALEWAGELHQTAQREAFGKFLLSMCSQDHPVKPEAIVKFFEQEVRRGAKYPQRSTSVMANESALALLAVKAAFLDRFAPID